MQFTVRRGSAVLYRGDSLSAVADLLRANRVTLAPDPITFFSVCSGIEAASVAWKPLGWKCAGVAEIEKFPRAVLAHHYPDIQNHGDFTRVDVKRIGRVDILCGGTPCQSFSVAGARRSLDDARGNLTLAFVGLAHELKPRNVVWENVPGVLSTKDNAFGCFLAGLVGADDALPPPKGCRWPNAGMVDGPKGRAAWRILDAQYFGLAQRRKRVILVADFGNGADPAAVLFEPEGVRRHSPPSREAGQNVTGTLSARSSGGGGLGTDFDLNGGLSVAVYAPQIARCNATREGQSQDFESTTMVVEIVTGPISHSLKGEGADASEDGTGRGTPIICVHGTQDPCTSHHVSFALGRNNDGENVIAYMPTRTFSSDGGIDERFAIREICDALHTKSGSGNKAPLVQSVALRGREGGGTAELGGVLTSAARRLTPRECERIMGFQFLVTPDYPGAWRDEAGRWWSPDYTAIPWRGKVAADCPDGPRYKALGNSWAVPKFRWLGERIARLMPR